MTPHQTSQDRLCCDRRAGLGQQGRLAIFLLIALSATGGFLPNSLATGQEGEPNYDTLANSAQIPVGREAQLFLEEAQASIARNDFDAAIRLLDRVFAMPDEQFVQVDEQRYIPAREVATRFFAKLPAAQRQQWEQQVEDAARKSLEAAVTMADRRSLQELAKRYAPSAVGREALRHLAGLYFDRSQFDEAASACRKLVEHPAATPQDIANGTARLIAVWIKSGDLELASRYINDRREYFDKAWLPTTDGELKLMDWVHQNFPEVASSELSPTVRKVSASTSSEQEIIPSPTPEWDSSLLPNDDVAAFVRSSVQSWKERGVSLFWRNSPVVAGSVVVVRGIDDLTAFDIASGKVLWITPVGLSLLPDAPKLLENEANSQFISDAVSVRLLADAVQGTLCTDGQRVFGIVGINNGDPSRYSRFGFRGRGRRLHDLSNISNKLITWKVSNGDEEWSLESLSIGDASESDASEDDLSEPLFIHGPPLCRNGAMYVVAGVGAELRLLAMNASDGQIRWTLPMVDIPSASMLSRRQRQLACPVALSGGTLVCTTSAGVVLGCDLSTREWKWAFRYERDDVLTPNHIGRGRRFPDHFSRWWESWRESSVVTVAGMAVIATPDSDHLRALDLETGQLRWQRKRGNGRFIECSADRRLLVVDETHIAAIDPESGNDIWQSIVGTPSARGSFVGEHYLIPLQNGRVATVRMNDGGVRFSTVPFTHHPGTFVVCEGGYLSQTPERLVKFASLAAEAEKVAEQLRNSPADSELLRRQALLDRQAGAFERALPTLRDLVTSSNESNPDKRAQRRELRETLLAALHANPIQLDSLNNEISSLADGPNDQVEWLLAVIDAQLARSKYTDAVDACLRLLEISPSSPLCLPAESGSSHQVRIDRLVWGILADILNVADAEQLSQIDTLVQKQLHRVAANPDPHVLERFASSIAGLRWDDDIRRLFPHNRDFLREQLRLLEQVDDIDRERSAEALISLAQYYDLHGYTTDAAGLRQRLVEEISRSSAISSDRVSTMAAKLGANLVLQQAIPLNQNDPWGLAEPLQEEKAAKYRGAEFLPIPVEAERGSLFDRVSVYLQSQGKALRFQGDEFRSAWQVTLPETNGPYRVLSQLAHGWGVGHVLILRLGTELLAVSVLDERGEPEARILWNIDTTGELLAHRSSSEFRIQPATPGFGTDALKLLDRFGWTCARVGPVRPTYTCYLEGASLKAIDASTGDLLWQRSGIPHDARCDGNTHFVIVGRPNSREIDILRAADGKQIGSRELPVAASEFLQWHNGYGLLKRENSDTLTLEQINLSTSELNWQMDFPSRSFPFALDSKTVGVLTPDGTISFVSSETGHEIARHQLGPPERLQNVHVSRDSGRFYIAISAPVDPHLQRWGAEEGEFRNPVVKGPLYAFDRHDGRLLWNTVLNNEGFQLDQPREAPFLMLNYRRTNGASERPQDSHFVTRLIDQRTGVDLLVDVQSGPKTHGYKTVETFPDEHAVDVLLPDKTVRFRYKQ